MEHTWRWNKVLSLSFNLIFGLLCNSFSMQMSNFTSFCVGWLERTWLLSVGSFAFLWSCNFLCFIFLCFNIYVNRVVLNHIALGRHFWPHDFSNATIYILCKAAHYILSIHFPSHVHTQYSSKTNFSPVLFSLSRFRVHNWGLSKEISAKSIRAYAFYDAFIIFNFFSIV